MNIAVPTLAEAEVARASVQLVLSGDSHVCALGAPCRLDLPSATLLPMPRDDVELYSVEGPFPRDLAYWQDVVRLSQGRSCAICWGGNQHNQWFLFAPRPLFDFVLASRPDLPLHPGAEIVPEAMLRELFWPSVAILSAMLGELCRQDGSPVFILGTPPPKRDEGTIKGYLVTEPKLLALAGEKGYSLDDVAVTPAIVRLKLWCVVQELMAELASANRASFVEVPPETQDELGFLRPEFGAPDATHANPLYGRLMLDRLLDRVRP